MKTLIIMIVIMILPMMMNIEKLEAIEHSLFKEFDRDYYNQ